MARAFKLACAIGLLNPSLAVRVSTEGASGLEIDWKKLTVASAVGAHAMCGHAVGAAEEGCRNKPQRNLDKFDKIEAVLIDSLSEADEGAVEQLVQSMRRKGCGGWKAFFEDLEENLQSRGLTRIKSPTEASWWSSWGSNPGELNVEHYSAKAEDGSRAVVLKRYLAHEGRSPEEVAALQNALRAMQRKNGGGYLKVYATSHAPSRLAEETDAEVIVMMEPFSGSLREYFSSNKVSFRKRLSMFYSVMAAVEGLYLDAIPHNSVITPDNILVTADNTIAVLCPSIFNTDLKVCTASQNFMNLFFNKALPEDAVLSREILKEDIVQLGALLEYVLHASTGGDPEEVEVYEELAMAMKEGAFTQLGVKCRCGAARVFSDITVQLALHSSLDVSELAKQASGKSQDSETWAGLSHLSSRSLQETKKKLKKARVAARQAREEAEKATEEEAKMA